MVVQEAATVTLPAARDLNVQMNPFRASGTPGLVLPCRRPWVRVIRGVLVGQESETLTVGVLAPAPTRVTIQTE